MLSLSWQKAEGEESGGESKEGPDVLSEHPAPAVTQPVGK